MNYLKHIFNQPGTWIALAFCSVIILVWSAYDTYQAGYLVITPPTLIGSAALLIGITIGNWFDYKKNHKRKNP